MARGLGFEPRLLGPKPSVLPLDDPRMTAKPTRLQDYNILLSRLRISSCAAKLFVFENIHQGFSRDIFGILIY